ncbi:WxL protein peptidoglycan domain-containing protein [Micromonospora sp. CA-263727]|uniref:WxL protein peptidoglycan domain-containing protein n=1 Tax=Micromonospora sp. CA-263727 TaxID=3239967 RepID=UPI003D8E7217
MRTPATLAVVLALAAGAVLPTTPRSEAPERVATESTAASSLTWGVAPSSPDGPDGRPAFEYKLNPGARLTDYVAITNHSDQPITLDVYASDAFTTQQGGFDLLAATEKPVDVGAWVTFRTRTLTVPATSRLDVPFTLAVPKNATPGDHPGGIVASLAATGTDEQGNQVAVDHRVGARVYLRVTGELRPALDIEDLAVTHDGSWHPLRGGAVTAEFTLRNPGNVRLTGRPELTVTGPFGLARRVEVGGSLPEILPGDSYRTSVRLAGVPPLFRLQATVVVAPVAVTPEVLDPAPGTVTRRAALWALPWPQLVILLLAGAAIWLVVLRRRRRRRQLDRAVASALAQGRAEGAGSRPGGALPAEAGTDRRDTPNDTEGDAR